MAKAKKSKLTIEDALVPVEEQPYEIPENWCWTFVNAVCIFENGYAFKSDKFGEEGTPVIRISNIQENEVDLDTCVYTSEEDIEERFVVKKGDLLIAMSGATTGKNGIYLSDERAYLNQRVGNIKVRNSEVLLLRFRDFYIMSKQEEILNSAYGGAQPNISSTKIGEMLFPLPPLAERKRIVEQIENMFAKLDEAKEKAQESLDGFQTRIDSILHKAFSGDLSVVWRNENGISSVRENVIFRDILDVRDGTHDSPQYYDEGYPLVTSKNLKNGCITDKDIKYISKEDFDQINQRSKVDVGDILFAMIGTIGNPVVIEDEPNYAIKNVALFKNKGKVNPYFIKYYLESREVRDKMQKEAKGTTQKFVSLGYLRDFPIAIPSDLEQEYIVKKLDELLSKELQAVSIIEEVIEQIDLMKKSVLAKAFRGELGTNESEDESSIELLKSILEK